MKLAHILTDRLLAFIFGRNVPGFSTTSPSEFLGMMGLSEAALYAARLYKIVANQLLMNEESQSMDQVISDISTSLSQYNGDIIMRSLPEWVDALHQCYLNIVQRVGLSEDSEESSSLDVCLSIGPEISSLVSPSTTTTASDIPSSSSTSITLSNGVLMPAIGLGTWQLNGPDCEEAVVNAITLGYRHIDTAEAYGNEADIGRALRRVLESGNIQRLDLFIATKISFESSAGSVNVKNLFAKQLRDLQVDYIDLYMLHSPLPDNLQIETWTALEELHDAGLIRCLGLSNFDSYEMKKLYATARIKPMVVQNKWDIYHIAKQMDAQGDNVIATANELGVIIVGYSPFSSYPFVMMPAEDPIIQTIAKNRNISPSQVVLRWMLQSGAAVIPRSIDVSHLKENLDVLQLPSLSTNDMSLISVISQLTSSPASVTI